MKLIVVKCPKGKKVQVAQRSTNGAVCPENCPLKQSSRCLNKTFKYTKPLPDFVIPDIPYAEDFSSDAENAQSTAKESIVDVPVKAPIAVKQEVSSFDNLEVLDYDDPFANDSDDDAPVFTEPAYANGGKTPKAASDILQKYNNALIDESSIFAGIREKRPDEPCFVDGVYEFYERAPDGIKSAGTSKAALRYIFYHWYVSKIFKDAFIFDILIL